jgi:hypothetical protein
MLFESITNHESHETDWFSCVPADINNIRITVEIDDKSSSGEWLLKTHNTLTVGSKLLNQLTIHQKRQWSFFFNPSSSRDTLFFDRFEQTRSKTDFIKIMRSQQYTTCRFLVQVVCTWSQGDMKGCIFEASQVQFVVNPPAKPLFKFSKERRSLKTQDEKEVHLSQGKSSFITIKAKEHRVYGKFMKMIEMGIPIVAVNQKLTLTNIKIPDGWELIQPNDPMPKEWMETHCKDASGSDETKESEQVPSLLTGTVLRPLGDVAPRPAKKDKIDSSFTITLEQIASAIMSLRKTKFF